MANKMNPAIKAQWVAALRSGEYTQAREVLKNGGGHCCLGVLCDLFASQHSINYWDSDTLGSRTAEVPNQEVCAWADMPESEYEDGRREDDPEVHIDGLRAALSRHNDNGKTFAQIADAIEAQL